MSTCSCVFLVLAVNSYWFGILRSFTRSSSSRLYLYALGVSNVVGGCNVVATERRKYAYVCLVTVECMSSAGSVWYVRAVML